MITQETKDGWLKRLRSGKYKQGRGVLKRNDEYCCLGVLAELLRLPEAPSSRGDDGVVEFEGRRTYLRHKHLCSDTQTYLVELNDDECLAFSEIADWIEENVECTQ